MNETGHCDFCFARLDGRQRKYSCRDFEAQPLPDTPRMHSRGAFLACSMCGFLIDGEHWDTLLDRSLNTFSARHGIHDREIRAKLREHLRDWQRQFREHRAPYDSDN